MKHGLFPLALLAASCGPTVAADRQYARDLAVAIDDGDERCAKSGEPDDVLRRCRALRNQLKPIVVDADRDADGGTK